MMGKLTLLAGAAIDREDEHREDNVRVHADVSGFGSGPVNLP